MTKTAMALVLYTAGTVAYAGEAQQSLTVYVQNRALVPSDILIPAEAMAGKMFAKIGLSLEWRSERLAADSSQPIFVELVTRTPENRLPGTLAFALPYEGRHLTVFADRVEAVDFPKSMLAHVLVHEITHLLQGVGGHSDTGIMKAHWSGNDLSAIRFKALPFASQDVELMYAGLAKRGRTVAMADTHE
jgi:hypothetical protein